MRADLNLVILHRCDLRAVGSEKKLCRPGGKMSPQPASIQELVSANCSKEKYSVIPTDQLNAL